MAHSATPQRFPHMTHFILPKKDISYSKWSSTPLVAHSFVLTAADDTICQDLIDDGDGGGIHGFICGTEMIFFYNSLAPILVHNRKPIRLNGKDASLYCDQNCELH